jgi:mannose-6-phosphate isomerase-like protein (cupin superfamily)
MRIETADAGVAKGWYAGPWNSDLEISIGYANEGVNDPHLHQHVKEVYFIAKGTVEMRINKQTVVLKEKDIIMVEPGEAHTFLRCSPDYFHFVIQIPGLTGAEAKADKVQVSRSRLGLSP